MTILVISEIKLSYLYASCDGVCVYACMCMWLVIVIVALSIILVTC